MDEDEFPDAKLDDSTEPSVGLSEWRLGVEDGVSRRFAGGRR